MAVGFVRVANVSQWRRSPKKICTTKAALFSEGLQVAGQAYFSDLAILHKFIGIPAIVAKYEHPVVMTASVLLLGGIGAKLGFQSREEEKPAQTRGVHVVLMSSLLVMVVAGFGGGTLSQAMQDEEIWKSAHSYTAIAAVVLLGGNAVLGAVKARSLHARFGLIVLLGLGIHSLTGLSLLFAS